MAVSIHWSPAPTVAVGTQTVHFNRPDNTQSTTNNASTQTGEEIKKTNARDPYGVTTNSIAAGQVGCKMGMVHIGTQALSWTEIVDKILSKIPHQDPSERIDAKWMYLEDILSLLMKKLACKHQQNTTIETTSGNSCDKMAEEEKAANPERKCSLQAKQSKKKKHKHKKDIDKKALLQLPNNKRKAKTNSRPHPSKVGKRKYKCQFCSQICATSTNLAIHERIHTGEKPYPCSHCDKSFSSKTKVTIHERLHTGDKPFKCSFCDARFVSSSYMSKHVKAMHTGKPHLCETCGKDFLFKTQLIEHERSHSGLTPFKCQQCKKSFSLKSNLMAHVKRVHVANRPHQCGLCKVKFHGKAEYRLHMQTHNSEPSCLCEQCGKAFHRSDYLARHIRTVHNEKRVKPHVCPFCNKRLARKHVLVLHIRAKHTFEKPYKCPHCVKTWVSKHDLDRHVRTHTGEKPYQCQQCQKQFKSSSNFAKHRKSHKEDSTATAEAKPTNNNAEIECLAGAEQSSKEGSLVSGEEECAQLPNCTSSSTLVPFSSIKHTGLTRSIAENISVPANENISLLPPVTSKKHPGMEFSQQQQGIFQAQVNPMTASGTDQSITQINAVSNTPLLPMGSFISALQASLVPGNDEEAVNQERQNQSGNDSLITGMPLMQMLQHSTVTTPNVGNPRNHSHGNHNVMSIGNFLSPVLQNRLPGSTVDHDNRLPTSASNQGGTTAPLIVSMLQQSSRPQAQADPQRHQQLMRNDPSLNLTVPPSGTWQDWYQ